MNENQNGKILKEKTNTEKCNKEICLIWNTSLEKEVKGHNSIADIQIQIQIQIQTQIQIQIQIQTQIQN